MRISDWSSDVCSSDLLARQRVIDLRDDLSLGVVTVGIDRRNGADAARRGPGAARHMVGRRHALAAFDQRPDFTPAIKDGLQTFEHFKPSLSPPDRKSTRLNSSH